MHLPGRAVGMAVLSRAPPRSGLASCDCRPLVRAWRTPESSVGEESTCNAGDPNAGGSIPGLGRSTGEGIDYPLQYSWASLLAGKESTCNIGVLCSTPGLGRSPGEGKGYPLQYSGLENSMDCIVHGVTKSRKQLSDFHFPFGRSPAKQCWSCKANRLIVMMEDPRSERRDVLPKVMRPVQAEPLLGTQSSCRCACRADHTAGLRRAVILARKKQRLPAK